MSIWTLRIFGTAHDSNLPDLAVGPPSGPSTGSAGAVIPVRVRVMNQAQATTASFKVGLYLGSFVVIDAASNWLLGTITVHGLRADRSFSGIFPVTIPATLPPRTCYLGAITDIDGSVPESDKANNDRASIRPIEITN